MGEPRRKKAEDSILGDALDQGERRRLRTRRQIQPGRPSNRDGSRNLLVSKFPVAGAGSL